jgi:dolichyl-phosphate-mannose--protein O-mannosyl transferase
MSTKSLMALLVVMVILIYSFASITIATADHGTVSAMTCGSFLSCLLSSRWSPLMIVAIVIITQVGVQPESLL